MSRDFRRAAVFRWTIPAPAALSSAAIAARRASGVVAALASVRRRDRTAWFCRRRRSAWRIRFNPDRDRLANPSLLG